MKKAKLFRIIMAFVLCVAMILPYVPVTVSAAPLGNFDKNDGFKGLNISIIGDSISTYEGITNNKTYNPLYLSTSAAKFGTYYGDSARTDFADYDQVKWEDTWWKQTIDTLGLNLLVNNAWSGSYVLKDDAKSNSNKAYGAAAYKARSVNLHNGSKKPDIIAVYLGTNDVANYSTTSVGSKANVDTASERNALFTSVNSYKTPTTSIQAYYIMLSRMIATYPDAEIYCMTPTVTRDAMASGKTTALNNFNDGVRYLVDYFAGLGKKVYLVDLDKNVGLVDNSVVKNYYFANNVHPDLAGMDWITTCFISELLEHSTKANVVSHEVSYNLTNSYVTTGLTRRAIEGKPFTVDLMPYKDYEDIQLTVTMKDAATGQNVTIPGGGVDGSSVYIPNVTGPISITAKTGKSVSSYQWIANSEAFASAAGNGFEYNRNTLVSGTYKGSTSSGAFTDIQYSLQEPVVLEYDKPWELEYKGGGGTYAGGIMLFNKETDSPVSGNMYIHITQTNVFFGYRDGNGYNNSGISWETIATKMGSKAGADYRKETHTFRFVNEPNGTNNKIYLYVDGVKIGSMDSTKMIGSSATNSNVSKINISGKDFVFNYIGSASHPIRNCSFSYIKVWENGEKNMNTITEPENHRWELSADKNSFVSVENDNFAENGLSLKTGTVFGGTFTGARFKLDKQVVLMHDEAWNLEWVSEGTWTDSGNGAMLFAGASGHNDLNSYYLYRRNNSTFIALGERKGGVHNNYGVSLSGNGIDGTVKHKYALVNEVTTNADGSYKTNMVYLYVDDVKIDAMNHYYEGGTDKNKTDNWVAGKDFVFSYIGTEGFPVGNCSIEYLQVSFSCIHNYKSVVTAPTCTGAGYTTHTCTECGDSYTDSTVAAKGHTWVDATCTEAKTCSVCGTTEGAAAGHNYKALVTAPTCTANGYTTHTCTGCGDSYTDSIVPAIDHTWVDATCTEAKTCSACGATEGDSLGHDIKSVITAPTCTEDGYTTHTCVGCDLRFTDSVVPATGHDWNNGTCRSCGTVCDHNYVNDFCTVCGMKAVTDYYLFGWINGANYACEEDAANLGIYKFVNGTLTATFDVDSYVAVKTGDNAKWYMSQAYDDDGYASLYLTSTGVSEKVYVPGGVEVTFTLVENWDGSLILSYVTAEECDHVSHDTNGVCSNCGKTVGHNFAMGGCTICGIPCTHSYTNGVCTICGHQLPTDYYLFGWINGADYACEGDAANMGEYKFVNGTLTTTFTEDSYVAVKVTDNRFWYMCEGYYEGITSCRMYNADNLTNPEKMKVPGGVEVTFTLQVHNDNSVTLSYTVATCDHASHDTNGICTNCGASVDHSYADGICTICGAADPDHVVSYYLVGSMNGWTEHADFKLVGNNGVYTVTTVLTAGEYTFKVKDSNGVWYPDGVGNDLVVNVAFDSEVTFTFDPATGETTAEVAIVRNDSPDIKWQVTAGTNADSASTNLRFLTWVDALENYSAVTFHVTLNGKTIDLECTTVYTAILASGVAIRNPANVFKNPDANYFATYTLKNIPNSAFNSPIVVSVTWTDLQGNETTSDYETIIIADDWT